MFFKPRKIVIEPNTAKLTSKETLDSILKCLKPINYICKFIGLNAVKYKNGQFVKVKKTDWIYLAFYVIFYVFISIYSIYMLINNSDDLNVNKIMILVEVLVMSILMVVVVVATFLTRSLTVKSFEFLAAIDVSFFKNKFQFDYSRLLRQNYMLLIYVASSVVIRLFLMLSSLHLDVIQQFTIFIAALIKAMSKYQFVVFVLQLQMRFEKINNVITSFYVNKAKLVLDPNTSIIQKQLYTLCRLHYKLADVIQKINSAFAIQLLCTIGVTLFDILFQAYYLYFVSTGKSGDEGIRVDKILCPIAWLVDETVEIYWLVYACASTCDNANDTPTILHELRNKSFDMELESDIQTFSLQMLHQKVQFSVLGFFVVDYTLIYSILGAVTTYLVIFIQFDQSSNQETTEIDNATIANYKN